jgi:hypothetical protein
MAVYMGIKAFAAPAIIEVTMRCTTEMVAWVELLPSALLMPNLMIRQLRKAAIFQCLGDIA